MFLACATRVEPNILAIRGLDSRNFFPVLRQAVDCRLLGRHYRSTALSNRVSRGRHEFCRPLESAACALCQARHLPDDSPSIAQTRQICTDFGGGTPCVDCGGSRTSFQDSVLFMRPRFATSPSRVASSWVCEAFSPVAATVRVVSVHVDPRARPCCDLGGTRDVCTTSPASLRAQGDSPLRVLTSDLVRRGPSQCLPDPGR